MFVRVFPVGCESSLGPLEVEGAGGDSTHVATCPVTKLRACLSATGTAPSPFPGVNEMAEMIHPESRRSHLEASCRQNQSLSKLTHNHHSASNGFIMREESVRVCGGRAGCINETTTTPPPHQPSTRVPGCAVGGRSVKQIYFLLLARPDSP